MPSSPIRLSRRKSSSSFAIAPLARVANSAVHAASLIPTRPKVSTCRLAHRLRQRPKLRVSSTFLSVLQGHGSEAP
eukprot:4304532-Prymnesium_polylepis.1